ncbi:protein FAM169B isoform X2 [Lepisosteus oculatus]|uniref:protein FAM169B isoform X2 n=1 Tax=Lepisosteus oculatus TaxID=7918 RepID=UPI00371B18CE
MPVYISRSCCCATQGGKVVCSRKMETHTTTKELQGGKAYPVDRLSDVSYQTLKITSEEVLSRLKSNSASETEWFVLPEGLTVKIEQSNVSRLSLFGDDDPAHAVLALLRPENKTQVLALYLDGTWWPLDDVLKTSDPSRAGLVTVQSIGERVVLFLLSQVVFGTLERPVDEDIYFTPHPAGELGKILWRDGEAAGFYTIKRKGSLCDSCTSQSYTLPVLDTLFVRRRWRRAGLALGMLEDFCSSFASEEALGISCPISASMYQVCRKFLLAHEELRDRLFEVEAPGGWSQRSSVWLRARPEGTAAHRSAEVLNADPSGSRPLKLDDGEQTAVVKLTKIESDQPLPRAGSAGCETPRGRGHKRTGPDATGNTVSKRAKKSE